MTTYLWPGDPGWPTAEEDDAADVLDPDAEVDEDILSLHAVPPHLLDDLTDLELAVVRARFGFDGHDARTLDAIHTELGVARSTVSRALHDALVKLRAHLV
jgi:DNA-directed RNA polymerase sigma subunit (sigma70/sigma32)